MKSVFAAVVICLFMFSVTAEALTGGGRLTLDNRQMEATGVWSGLDGYTPAYLVWSATESTVLTGGWHYSYTLTVGHGGISHIILETSDNFKLEDLRNLQISNSNFIYGMGTWYKPAPNDNNTSNPNMPGDIHGIKFEYKAPESTGSGTVPEDVLSLTINFDSDRVPVWGDFYAKDGKAGGKDWNACWNTGFTSADVDSQPGHILVPDTETGGGGSGAVPEAGTLALSGTGLATMLSGLSIKRARTRRK